jgi:predicted Zn finger-like uncharacterized protein
MNFLCENCKQKYHVADEKLRGREVTKFKCKKCEHIIEVRGDAVGVGDDAEPASASMLSSIPPATAAAPVTPKPAVSSFGAPKPAGGLPTAAPKPAATTAPKPASTGFPAAGANKPLGGSLPTSGGAAKPATSTGLPTAGAPKPAAGKLPTTAPRPTAGAAAPRQPTGATLPTTGSAARVASPATASPSPAAVTALKPATTALAAKPAAQPSALRSSITQTTSHAQESAGPKRTTSSASTSALLNPSETGWYAGIREVPVGPLTKAELASKIDAGDINSDTLVWREGLDDWRPLSSVNELSDLLREASKRVSDTMLGAQAKKAPSNVVPLSRANTAKDQDEPEESTRLTSLSDLIATAEGSSAQKKPAAKSEPPAAEHKPEPKAPAHEFKTEPQTEPKTEPKTEPAQSKPAALDDHLDDAFFMGPSKKPAAAPAAAAAPVVAAAIAAPAPAPTAAVETFGPPMKTATIESVAPPKQEEKKGGVPMGVVVMMGGLLVLVGGGGLYAGTRINQQQQPAVQQPAVQQPAQQPAQPTRLDPHVGVQINLNDQAAQPQPTQPEQGAQNTTPPPAANGSPTVRTGSGTSHSGSSGTTARASTATSTGTTTGLTAEQLRQMQAQLGGAASGGIASSGGGPVGAAARGVQSPSSSEPVAGPTGSIRAGQVLETFRRTNVVGSCWQQQITRNPAHPPERINVTLTVNSTGRATTVNVQGANDPALASCIQSRARAQNFGPGGQIDAQASFNLAIGN